MSRAFKLAAVPETELDWPILAAARRWRQARDQGLPVQSSLYAELERSYLGLLAPVFDGLFSIFEAGLGRRFEASNAPDACPTGDEMTLLELLHDGRSAARYLVSPMVQPFRIAARSTKIMFATHSIA
ncbi:hypothetical protein PX554_18425 [Sphingomonas sp. H39-1-10]|uniref:hypothetical protein n=1 Tax=Sphingomonadales TaxID=204457 RepID=UPI000C20C579|nr:MULTISPECIES: hypothetical protein [Sphingomonadaceae]MDF0490113.1 hypothetical protein [Sphingomonas pollutisoli]PJG45466.1 hypothetical protein CAF53_22240 [Sphingobium sp. LB126]